MHLLPQWPGLFARLQHALFADGLTVDAEGFLWVAHWFGGCVARYDPDGVRERKMVLPATQTSSPAFGGPDLDEIYVTTAGMNNCLMLASLGYDSAQVFVGGPLYGSAAEFRAA